ncbi:MAG TPA: carboxypeptidase-like regulatory domain-containing protein, partial [Terriglobia bacterium]|nr:carboxypeptidase-like regulatory domain-containing protein [Terriglobia bacterium]
MKLTQFTPAGWQTRLCSVLLILLCLFIAPTLQAQTVNATLTGTVKDSSGAVIASAKVVATNTGTNLTHETVT